MASMPTIQERLDAVNAAIDGFFANGAIKSYKADGVEVTRENLSAMTAYAEQLEGKLAARNMGGRVIGDLRGMR